MSSTSKPGSDTPSSSSDAVRESAHQIWLAGLGAFNKAQEEGSKMFDALVQEGLAMQRRAQELAEQKFSEASQKMSAVAQEVSQRAGGQWDKLESLFEERVARALQRLGMPTAREVQALRERLDQLEHSLQPRSPAARKPTAAARPAPRKTAARKAPAKKAAARKKAA
jgi:poly(hydroxyalkanoate) granule-associated protein